MRTEHVKGPGRYRFVIDFRITYEPFEENPDARYRAVAFVGCGRKPDTLTVSAKSAALAAGECYRQVMNLLKLGRWAEQPDLALFSPTDIDDSAFGFVGVPGISGKLHAGEACTLSGGDELDPLREITSGPDIIRDGPAVDLLDGYHIRR